MTSVLNSRIAPTPSGFLHIGNLWSFVLTWLMCKHSQGKLYLRIDDNDRQRFRPEYLEDIQQTLHWLGVKFDAPPLISSGAETRHKKLLQELIQKKYQLASPIYGCQCSRSQIKKNLKGLPPHFLYPGTCRELMFDPQAQNVCARFCVPVGMVCQFNQLGGKSESYTFSAGEDFIIKQKNGQPSYQVSSLADDMAMDISLIVRGRDLLPSTAYQMLLAKALEESSFPSVKFFHHPLILGEKGEKLSKSNLGPRAIALRETYSTPEKILTAFAGLLGITSKKITSLQDLLGGFHPEQIPHSDITLRDLKLN